MTRALRSYRRVLRHRAYRTLWSAAVISRAGDTVNFVALPLFVYAITRSPAAVSGLVISEIVGAIGGATVANPIVDRLPPRAVLIVADVVRCIAAASLAAAPTAAFAYAVAFILAAATGLFSPTSAALVPRLVPDDELTAANALQWTAGVVLQLVLAPLSGLLVAVATARVPFALNALSFLVSALILLRLPRRPALAAPSHARSRPFASLGLLWHAQLMRPLLLMQALAALAVGATSALLVVLARQGYGLSPTGYGLWLAAIGAGALAGPVLVTALARVAARTVVSMAYAVRGAGDVLLSVLPSGATAAAVLALYGVNTSSGMVSFQRLVQEGVDPELRGRAFALLDGVWQSGRLASIAAGGVAASAFGVRPLYAVGGALLVVAALVGAAGLPRSHVAAALQAGSAAEASGGRE
ncbi:MAG: MFS transporter [Candidatus Dormibacteraeota bacterium]|nr:MFS transporter [Candidatus Dormibacteraeota bacterium]